MDLLPSRLLSHEVWLFDESGVNLPCVGTIISSYLILTLASCLHGNGKRRNKFSIKTKSGNGLNSNLKLEEEQIRSVSRIIFHSRFKNSSAENDVAILVLDDNLDWSVKVLPILGIWNGTGNEPTWTNFSGRFCRGDSELYSLQISDSSQCSFALVKGDEFCLFPLDSNAKDSSCSRPFPGSSLICSDEKHGQFLCGILALSPEKLARENGQIYTNIQSHLKWIESVSAETKSGESRKLTNKESKETNYELPVDDYDYEMVINGPDFKNRIRKTRNADYADYDVGDHVSNGVIVNKSDPIPYQLSIRYCENLLDGIWQHICGAVILDETTAVTAAHCFDKTKDVSHYRVVAGENLLHAVDAEEQVLPLKKVIIHPEYTYFTTGNDLAILHVDKFQFHKFVGRLWLSPFPNNKLTNKSAVISGWGKVSEISGPSSSLQKGNVSILPRKDCLNRLSNRMKIPVRNGVVCALDPLVRTCAGDSGGPLVIQNYKLGNSTGNLLVGLTSFGAANCSHRNSIGVFTEISSFYNWIQENRATPLGCGGFISLVGVKEIVYKVPEELRGQKSVCLWVVAAPRSNAIETKVLNNPTAQFQPEESILFTLYNFKKDAASQSKIFSQDEKWTIAQPFFVLYFRTNSSAPNSGFHIRLKEAPTSSCGWFSCNTKNEPQKPVKYLEVGLAGTGGTTSEIQEFKYPLPPASEYANDERTFIIVKPGARQGKLKINLKSVSTEEKSDWMEILSFESGPVSHHSRFRSYRCSGNGSCSNKSFEAKEDEPFIIYFHSDGSNTKSGFRFSYSENKNPGVYKNCGGFINLAQSPEQEIIYKVPSEEPERQRGSNCLWIVSTGRKDANASIEAAILNNPSAQFNENSDRIFVSYKFGFSGSYYRSESYYRALFLGKNLPIRGPFMTLNYRTTSSEQDAGFHLKLRDSITQSNITERLDVKRISLPNAEFFEGEIQKFSYPSKSFVSSAGASKYSSNERTFFILKPQKPGAKIRVNFTFVNIQEKYDRLQISSYKEEHPIYARFNSRNYQGEKILEGLEDEPVFLYFQSGESGEGERFKIEYSEIPAPKPSCGGFIRLRAEHEIVYTVPAELRGEKSVCVWVVAARGASSIETVVLSNPQAQFQPEESTLSAIYDFTQNDFKHSKILRIYKTWTIGQPFFVLHFRTNSSAPNSGFHILLKEAGRKETQDAVNYLEVGLEDGSTPEIQEFKYPLHPAMEYAYNERTFIIVKPGARHETLMLNLHYLDRDEYDWIDIFSVGSEPVSHFRSRGDDWTSMRVFEAAEDEPIIIYFQSDRWNIGPRFEFSYAEKRIFDVQSRPLTFYEDRDFSGPEIKLHVRNFCQDIPSEWDDKVSSLRSTLCLTFYEDKGCSSRSQQLTGSHSNLSLYYLDDKISSFELCETTNKREESPLFVTAYEFENFTGESTKLSLDCGCVGYKFGWNNRINSIKNPQNLCVIGYDDVRCKGETSVIESDSRSFQPWRMTNRLTSFRICPGESNCP